MRILMWFTVGFSAAIAAGVYLVSGWWIAGLMAIAVSGAIVLFLLKRKPCLVGATVLVGVSVGLLWQFGFDILYLQPLNEYDGSSVSAVVTVSDYSYETDYGVAADGKIDILGKQYKVRVYVTTDASLVPGDQLQGEFKLRLTTANSIQGGTYHQGKGIFLLAYADKDTQVIHMEMIPLKYFAAMLRHHITMILDSAFPEDTVSFARALLLGDSNMLSYEDDTALKVSGIRHVIAVSGLHVSILIALVYFVSGRRRILTAIIGFPTLLLFAAVAGFTPSVVRACTMQGLVILGLLIEKEYDPPTALSFAVLTMLAVNPLTITSVSFQLSVGSLVGIFLCYQPLNTYLTNKSGYAKGMTLKSRFVRWCIGSFCVTLSAMAVTTPLVAYYFGCVSLVGIVTNLLTMWIVSLVFYGIMLTCILGAIWPPAANIVASGVSYPIKYVLFVAKGLSKIPFAALYTCSIYVVIWLVFVYILLVGFVFYRKKHPLVFSGCVLVTLSICLFLSWLEPRLDNYRVTVLDVGQGQSILVQCDGKNYLVDCGGDNEQTAADVAAQMLLSQGVLKLDGLIFTHYDSDHAGGAPYLLSRIPADKLYLPDIDDATGITDILEQRYYERIVWIDEMLVIGNEKVQISFIPNETKKQSNESSMCILFQAEECDILITGDRSVSGERILLESVSLPQLDLLVVGHHGSDSSTGLELLNATKPRMAVISVGEDNPYGHPKESVIKRLQLYGCEIYRTDLLGTIIFRG